MYKKEIFVIQIGCVAYLECICERMIVFRRQLYVTKNLPVLKQVQLDWGFGGVKIIGNTLLQMAGKGEVKQLEECSVSKYVLHCFPDLTLNRN